MIPTVDDLYLTLGVLHMQNVMLAQQVANLRKQAQEHVCVVTSIPESASPPASETSS